MVGLTYDGSWNGLLTTFQYCLSRKIELCEITRQQEESATLFGGSEEIQTNFGEAIKLKDQIKATMGQQPLRLMYHAYLLV